VVADEVIANYGVERISNGDVILTYARYIYRGLLISTDHMLLK
jgi:hypothetical protein